MNREESRFESGRFTRSGRGVAGVSLATVPLVVPEVRAAVWELRS